MKRGPSFDDIRHSREAAEAYSDKAISELSAGQSEEAMSPSKPNCPKCGSAHKHILLGPCLEQARNRHAALFVDQKVHPDDDYLNAIHEPPISQEEQASYQPVAATTKAAAPSARVIPGEWVHEDELPDDYPYDEMYPLSKVGHDGLGGVRMFPKVIRQSEAAMTPKFAPKPGTAERTPQRGSRPGAKKLEEL